ncbi:EamA family transporter [Bacteriovoracaceae bacterium]|nr:EamA family transporter [Bacteriovoracaceae bacterium]
MIQTQTTNSGGNFSAFLAYLQWGFFPLYFAQIKSLSPYQLTSIRTILCLLTIIILGKVSLNVKLNIRQTLKAFTSIKKIGIISCAAFLLAINYVVFIYLIQDNNTLAIGIGYFLSPVYKAAIGLFFLKEKVNRNKIISLILMSLTFILLVQISLKLFFLSFILGFSFSLYGLLKKQTSQPFMESLTQELIILTLASIFYLNWDQSFNLINSLQSESNKELFFIFFSGVVTLSPLLFFNIAAKKIEFFYLALWHYLAPSLQTLLAIFYFSEPLSQTHIYLFIIMFLALLPNMAPSLYKIFSSSRPKSL